MLKKQLDEQWNHGYCHNPNEPAQWQQAWGIGPKGNAIDDFVRCLNNIWHMWKFDYSK